MSRASRHAFLCVLLASLPALAQPPGSFVLPPADAGKGADLSQALTVYVERIEVRGATAIDPDDIAALTTPYERREVSSAELRELRLALSKLYADGGYVNSGVVLPDQTIGNGLIYYEAIEGQLTRVEIEGDPHLSNRYIEKRIARLVDAPLNIGDIQYALRHLQNDPNVVRLDARLAPGDDLGQSVLRLAIDEPTRFEFGVGVNNHRATSTGESEAGLYLRSRNLTGTGEVIDVSSGISEGADDWAIGVTWPISRRDTELQLYAADSDSSIVEARLRPLDIESFTETRGIRVTHPFVNRLDATFAVMAGYESKHSETTLAGLPFSLSPGAQDGVSETNVALLGGNWTGRGTNHVLTTRVTFRHGSDYQDATIFEPTTELDVLSNPTFADGRFDLAQLQLLYLKRLDSGRRLAGLNDRAHLVVRFSGQLSDDPLLAIEKIAIGGYRTVRGYPENFLVRDNGVAASLEFQLPLPGYSSTPSARNLMIVPFIDYGRSWDEADTDTISVVRDTSDASSIVGAGVGFVWEPIRGFRTEIYWGADVADDLAPGDDPREFRESSLQDSGVHFALSYSRTW